MLPLWLLFPVRSKSVLSFPLSFNKGYDKTKRKIIIFRFRITREEKRSIFSFCCHGLSCTTRKHSYYFILTICATVDIWENNRTVGVRFLLEYVYSSLFKFLFIYWILDSSDRSSIPHFFSSFGEGFLQPAMRKHSHISSIIFSIIEVSTPTSEGVENYSRFFQIFSAAL